MQLPESPNDIRDNRTRTSDESPGNRNIILPDSEIPAVPVVPECTKKECPPSTPERDAEKGLLELESMLGSNQTSIENFRVRLQSDRGEKR